MQPVKIKPVEVRAKCIPHHYQKLDTPGVLGLTYQCSECGNMTTTTKYLSYTIGFHHGVEFHRKLTLEESF